jgi:O-antigen/teichoic acid export membrane protein
VNDENDIGYESGPNRLKSLPAWTWSIATNAINLVFGILTGVLVARLLGPGARGELAEVQFWAGAVAALGICSLPSALSLLIAKKQHQTSILGSAMALAIALSIVSLVGGTILLGLAVAPSLRNLAMLYLLAFIPANFIGLTLVAIDHGNQNFSRYNLFRLLPQAIYFASILLLWHLGLVSIGTLLAASWLGTMLICFLRWRLARTDIVQLPHPLVVKKLLRTGIEFHAAAFAGILFQNADRLICMTYFSHADLGRYAVALTISGAGLGLVSSATSIVLFPKLATASTVAARRHLVRNVLGASCMVTLVTNVIIALAVPFALPLLFGMPFATAIPVAILLCFAQIPASFVHTTTVALRALDDWRAGPYAQLLALIVFVPSSAALVPKFGLNGIAVSLLLSQLIAAAMLLRRMRWNVGLNTLECLVPDLRWVISRLAWLNAEAS